MPCIVILYPHDGNYSCQSNWCSRNENIIFRTKSCSRKGAVEFSIMVINEIYRTWCYFLSRSSWREGMCLVEVISIFKEYGDHFTSTFLDFGWKQWGHFELVNTCTKTHFRKLGSNLLWMWLWSWARTTHPKT